LEKKIMAYFVRIGAIQQNKSGVGARGYQLFRRGRQIVERWGAVKVAPGRKFSWAYSPQDKTYRYKSEEAAREAMQSLVRRRIEQEDYERLPMGAKITP
jgi:hypothetical protein